MGRLTALTFLFLLLAAGCGRQGDTPAGEAAPPPKGPPTSLQRQGQTPTPRTVR
jgi:hypothetical protein